MKLLISLSVEDFIPESASWFDKFVINAFSRDYKNAFHSKQTTHSIIRQLKKAGVQGMELSVPFELTTNQINSLRQIAIQTSFPVIGIHQPLSSLVSISFDKITKLCQIANTFSAKFVVLHLDVIGEKVFSKEFVDLKQKLEKGLNIKILLENAHKSPLNIFKSYSWQSDKFSKLIFKKTFNSVFDTTHLAQAGGDIINFYLKNQSHICEIQISDYKKVIYNSLFLLTTATHLPLEKGQLPIKHFLKTLKNTAYSGYLSLEIVGNLTDWTESAKMIKEYVD